jgi:3-oxoacyl-[acyl-carrier protein] reductase
MEKSSMNTKSNTAPVAFVVGGSRGIGAAIVKRLAADGFAVTFTYVSAKEKADAVVADILKRGGRATAIAVDSADAAALSAAIDKVAIENGRLDVLVNNAGILIHGLIDDYRLEDFDRMVTVNIRGAFVAAQAAARHMKAGGRIIIIGSNTAEFIGTAGASIYVMTKAAIKGLVKGLAHDLGPRGITITNVQPGPTHTDMLPTDAAVLDMVTNRTAVKRLADDTEIAHFVAFLSGDNTGFISGASLTIDGGYSA